MNNYKIERVNPSHYPLIKKLYLNAFKLKLTLDDITKRFNTKSLGCEHIGFVAIDNISGVAAAYYGIFPIKLELNGKTILAAQSGDTMTNSQHRMKGLFFTLANLTYQECRTQNIQLVFGQPNKNSHRGLLKLGWIEIDSIVRRDLKLKFKTIPLPKLSLRRKWLNKLYFTYAGLILKRVSAQNIQSFHNSIRCDYLKTDRNADYLQYKESADKFFLYIDDIMMWVKLTDVFWIGDFSDYTKMGPGTIKKIKKLACWLGYNTISFNINKSVTLPEAFNCFREYSAEPSMLLTLDPDLTINNILLTGADFDTW